MSSMTYSVDKASAGSAPKLPPRWFIRLAWRAHRALFRLTGGRAPLQTPKRGKHFGMMRLRTVGRRSGAERAVIIGYVTDGPALASIAMNGWDEADPAWWLNLQANPDATVDLVGGERRVRARVADGAERERLWATISEYPGYGDDLDAYASLRSRPSTVVVFEPRD